MDEWATAPTIVARWNVSHRRLNQIIILVGLGDMDSQHVRLGGKGWEYSPAAVGLLERELKSRGHKRLAGQP